MLLTLANQGEARLKALAGYRLVRELGRGGMGSVSLIRHERLGEEIALKIMLPRVAADERAKALFLRETENTKALKHPHVVQVRDSGCAHGVFFFTLEYCNGGSVRELSEQRRGPLPVQEACALVLQALDGLHYAHQAVIPAVKLADGSYGTGQGLVHRDVKPGNLFLVGTGSSRLVKLGDYGLAKAFDAAGLSGQTSTGAISGTPGFMPRQQVINFKKVRPEVDVWAMAASLYQVLTGTFPRDFPKGRDPWMQVLQTDAVPIRKRNAAIPKRLAQVVDHALVDQPEIGFKTALAFKQALEGVL
jgi:serine/threonine protein kinase